MNKRILFLFFFGILFLLSASFQKSFSKERKKELPAPEKINNILFYIQRSINISVINYVLNMDENGELNVIEPIKAYWKNYASDGSIEPLNYIQRKFAYGIEIKMLDTDKKSFCFNFVSYKKKKIFLIKSLVDNKYQAICEMNNKMTILDRIFIQIEGGSFWVPKIKYIEIRGKNISKNEEEVERIIP